MAHASVYHICITKYINWAAEYVISDLFLATNSLQLSPVKHYVTTICKQNIADRWFYSCRIWVVYKPLNSLSSGQLNQRTMVENQNSFTKKQTYSSQDHFKKFDTKRAEIIPRGGDIFDEES